MANSAPFRWSKAFNNRWYLVDEVEFIKMILPQGQWEVDTVGPVEITFDPNGWLHWREPDLSQGGSFSPDKVIHVEWTVT